MDFNVVIYLKQKFSGEQKAESSEICDLRFEFQSEIQDPKSEDPLNLMRKTPTEEKQMS